jgi:hypothetical protein
MERENPGANGEEKRKKAGKADFLALVESKNGHLKALVCTKTVFERLTMLSRCQNGFLRKENMQIKDDFS